MAIVLYVVGTDTGVGKTLITSYLLRSLKQHGLRVRAVKPFATGSLADARSLQKGHAHPRPRLEEITPFFFRKPLAPFVAAARLSLLPTVRRASAFLLQSAREADFLLVEGIGGVAVPIRKDFLFSDLIAAVPGKVLIVAPNRLGVLNHCLLTYLHLRCLGADDIAVLLNDVNTIDLAAKSNQRALKKLLPNVPIFKFPQLVDDFEWSDLSTIMVRKSGQRFWAWIQSNCGKNHGKPAPFTNQPEIQKNLRAPAGQKN